MHFSAALLIVVSGAVDNSMKTETKEKGRGIILLLLLICSKGSGLPATK